MSKLRLLLSLPLMFLSMLGMTIVFLFGVPAVIIGGKDAKKIFKSMLEFIYE